MKRSIKGYMKLYAFLPIDKYLFFVFFLYKIIHRTIKFLTTNDNSCQFSDA